MNLVAKIVRRKLTEYFLAIEAFMLLLLFRICLMVVPVRTIIGAITDGKKETVQPAAARLSESEMAAALRVQWAVRAAARHSPVEFVCFPQSLAAYWMLRRRGYRGNIVYGITRSDAGNLSAHTWLEMGDAVIVGDEESGGFTVVGRWG